MMCVYVLSVPYFDFGLNFLEISVLVVFVCIRL